MQKQNFNNFSNFIKISYSSKMVREWVLWVMNICSDLDFPILHTERQFSKNEKPLLC
jgi:hypothetical protein